MYRVIKIGNRRIVCMSESIADMLEDMKNRREILLEHIGKCIIWGKHYRDYNHWIHAEICVFINEFARTRVKTKMKPEHVAKKLFGSIGDDPYDGLNHLYTIQERCAKGPDPYPEVDIDYGYGDRFLHAFYEISDYISKYLCTHKIVQGKRDYREEFEPTVRKILDKYC